LLILNVPSNHYWILKERWNCTSFLDTEGPSILAIFGNSSAVLWISTLKMVTCDFIAPTIHIPDGFLS